MATNNPNKIQNRHEKESHKSLNLFFTRLSETVSIDFRNEEVRDIQSAVAEMLERIKERVNKQNTFRISHIEPGGGMAEKSAIWKWTYADGALKKPMIFAEFDFLAVLEDKVRRDDVCPGCQEVKFSYWQSEQFKQEYEKLCPQQKPESTSNIDVNFMFNIELLRCLTLECDCLLVNDFTKDPIDWNGYPIFEIRYKETFQKLETVCNSCNVDRSTGRLRIYTSNDGETHFNLPKCSLMFLWESKAHTLYAPRDPLSDKSTSMSIVPVFVDALPAIKTVTPSQEDRENSCFLVPKTCNFGTYFEHEWRKSYCKQEIKYINDMTDKHLRCFKILKYFTDLQPKRIWLKKYHVKTIAIHHSRNCSASSTDLSECGLEVFTHMMHAYENEKLDAILSGGNLLSKQRDFENKERANICRLIITLMSKVSEADTWETVMEKIKFLTKIRSFEFLFPDWQKNS